MTTRMDIMLTETLHPPEEFDDEAYVDSAEYKAATEGKAEVRRWKLYRAWPNTASS